ncbi:MAG: hypothetical protein R2799_09400 [Crocinitomicaceae bacterium]
MTIEIIGGNTGSYEYSYSSADQSFTIDFLDGDVVTGTYSFSNNNNTLTIVTSLGTDILYRQ